MRKNHRRLRNSVDYTCGSPKCHPPTVTRFLAQKLDFQPACEQELLSIMRTCAEPGHFVLCKPHRPQAHVYIKDKAFGLRIRPPDRNGDAARRVDRRKARDHVSRSEVCASAFPFLVQDACDPRDSRTRTRKGDVSGGPRLHQSHVPATRGGSSPPSAR